MKALSDLARSLGTKLWKAVKVAWWFFLGWFVLLTLILTFAPSLLIGLLAFNEGFMAYILSVTVASAALTFLPCIILAITGGEFGGEYVMSYLGGGFIGGTLASVAFFFAGLVQRVANEFGHDILHSLTPVSAAIWVTRVAFVFAIAFTVFVWFADRVQQKKYQELADNTAQV